MLKLRREGAAKTDELLRHITSDETAWMRATLDSLNEVFLVFGLDGRVVRWNKRVGEVTGYTDAEIASMNISDFLPKENAAAIIGKNMRRLSKEGHASIEVPVVTKDGRRIPYTLSGTLLKTPDGTPIGVCGIGRDLTEHNKLREMERRTHDVVVSVPVMVYGARPDWSVDVVSGVVEKITGHTRDDFLSGRVNWLNLVHPDDKERVLRESSVLVAVPGEVNQEYRITAKDGTVKWVRDMKRSVHKGGSLTHINGIVLDITEDKKTKQLRGVLVPICCGCKKIRVEKPADKQQPEAQTERTWVQPETFFMDKTGCRFSHGLCPDCFEKQMEEVRRTIGE